ncbi:MAG: transglutaminase-like cysteine peptidase [Pseudomonadota bacterium]
MWSRVVTAIAAAGALLVFVAPVTVQAGNADARFMRVHGTAEPPYGFVQFCKSFAYECRNDGTSTRRFNATPDRLVELDRINREINRAVAPATDEELFGVREHWTMPGARGDCEDYVVLKRRLLMDRGWPASALLITVVFDENGEGHAVLTARTRQGDFILDNKVDNLKLWDRTPYRFVMRQSYLNPRVWMALDPSMRRSPEMLAGVSTN